MSIDNLEANPKLREITSPRTIEACCKLEINPRELLISNYDVLIESIEQPAHQVIAKNHYDAIRQKKIALVRDMRQSIIDSEAKHLNSPTAEDRNAIPTASQVNLENPPKIVSNTLIQEAKRLEMVRQRQNKEIVRYVERESFLAVQREKLQEATRAEEKKARQLQLKLEKKRIELEFVMKQKIDKQKEEEFQQVQARKQQARLEFDLEAEIQVKEKEEQKKRLVVIREQDEERRLKMEEREVLIERELTLQIEASEKRRLIIEHRDEQREIQLFERRQVIKEKLLEERGKSHERILQALERNQKASEDKKIRYHEQQKIAEERSNDKMKDLEGELIKKAKETEYKKKQRDVRLSEFYSHLSERRSELIAARSDQEEGYLTLLQERKVEKDTEMFKKTLKSQELSDNVQRISRLDDNRRMELLDSIHASTIKSQSIKLQREDLLNQRKDAIRTALIQKHKTKFAMDKMRNSTNMSHFAKLSSTLTGATSNINNTDVNATGQAANDIDKDD